MAPIPGRRYFTRGFLRAIGWGALLLIAGTLLVAVPELAEVARGGLATVVAAAAGILATSRMPRHPVKVEGARNGAIAGLGVVGVAYLIAFLLALSARNGWDTFLPLKFVPFAAFFLGWLWPMGVAAAVAGAVTGHSRSRSA